MLKRHFRLILVPESPTDEISQFKCPYYLLSLLIAFAAIMLVATAGLTYYFVRQYSDMQQQTAGLPQLRRQVLRQQALIEESEETMREFRSNIAQLERAQKRLPLSDSSFEESGPFLGMGGEEYSETQTEEQSLSDFENDAGGYFSLVQENLQQQQQTTQDLEEYFDDQAQQIASTPYLWPVPGSTHVTSKFGMRTHPVTGQHIMHWGIDIGAAKGTPIVSTADGMVIFSGIKGTFGKGDRHRPWLRIYHLLRALFLLGNTER